ncbi:DNA polymerase III PolC-type [Corynebacterium urogenitale]|uniref:DNA polymerase III PolC-type n=1 Tax=Corynebacterium urogenitale TaxID=2487892 RepID=A0A5J6Z8Y3_9CORY|nr:DNA polymerase III PolC-type [Corynebacterium urogenitale]
MGTVNHVPRPHRTTVAPLSASEALGNALVIDVETTGLDPSEDRIIEIGAAHVIEGTVRSVFHELINPHRPISPFIEEITGLENRRIASARDSHEVLPEFLSYIQSASQVDNTTSCRRACCFVGHNVAFDLSFLGAELERIQTSNTLPQWHSLCTADLARRLIPRQRVGRYTLLNLTEYLQTQFKPSHRALADVKATVEVLIKLESIESTTN